MRRHVRFVWASLVTIITLAACAVGTTGVQGFDEGGDAGDPWHRDDAANANGEGGTGCGDLATDPKNCGSCGHACELADASALHIGSDDNPDSGIPAAADAGDAGAIEAWSSGVPACAASTCGVACPSAMTMCADDICYDTSRFHEHCGDCNTACAAAQVCSTGHCCDLGQAYCNTQCIDVLSNDTNCGGCSNECGAGKKCVAGKCSSCTINEALSASATSSGGGVTTYGPADMNDGVVETASCTAYTWITATNAPGTAWVQYTWPAAKTLTSMHVDTLSATVADSCQAAGRTLGAAQVQWWNGAAWITDGTVTGKLDDWDYTFTAPVTTTEVRLYGAYCTNTSGYEQNPVIFEWQVTGCN